jgi:phenylpropionate dioxygenase-like ring-hydroxylating dioxygenase large terminal subunit
MTEIETHWKKVPKTDESRTENLETQPLKTYRIFNNPKVVTESWYPVIASKKLKKLKSFSFKLGSQRLVVFRGEDNVVRALDAFCPHMGADLSRGKIEGKSIRCYFHRWKFAEDGQLIEIPCKKETLPSLKIKNYPVQEKFGFIWIYSGTQEPYAVPNPIGLENHEVEGRFVLRTKLFVHHHVLMASAIDLQHFASVHGLHANFDLDIKEHPHGLFHWKVKGVLNAMNSLRNKIARSILGDYFQYDALFSGGSMIYMTYGRDQYFGNKNSGLKLPVFHALWGCVPLENGLSEAYVFVLQKKSTGLLSFFKSNTRFAFTLLLLAWLKDDDVQAFPRMRFQAQNLIDQDKSVAKLIRLTETIKRSIWSYEN